MTRVVFFDAAHTLIDPYPPSARVYAEIGIRHGHRVTEPGLAAALRPLWWSLRAQKAAVTAVSGTSEEREREWWHQLVDRAYRESGETGGVGEACFEDIYGHFARGSSWMVFPEVRAVLEALRSRGVRACVLSNFDFRLRRVLEEHGLAPEFAHIFISSEVGWEKPSPRIYRAALEAAGVPPAQALMVGDEIGRASCRERV